jgi:HAE1 family hydrophobic/amphiphilic exporter-1
MNFANISAWSIRNPIPTIMLFIVLTIFGIVSFFNLRINNFPDIDYPLVAATVVQPGAAPSELETQVTRIVEDAVAGLGSVRHIRSTVNDGVSTTTIEFQLGTDTERATNDVRNAVTSIRAQLPGDVEDPIIQRIDITGGSLVNYVVRAPGMSPEELSWFVDNTVAKRLLAIRGVGQVQRDGGVDREIRVQLDPNRLASLGVTAGEVSQQLRAVNANLPGGRAEVAGSEQSIRTLGSARSLDELRETRIDLADGRSVRLRDLGEVTDSWAEQRGLARFNGQEVVGFGVLRSREASEVDVAEKAREVIRQLDEERDDLVMEEVTAQVEYVEESYTASLETLLIGAALAVFVVWFFLRDWRATLIAALAMPLSLIPTFWIMDVLNQSFNVVSLLALSLTIGILVDDAIVEIENIVRHIRQGKKPYPAAIEAADEIGLAVVATTATLVAVFAPTGFMPGVVGQFFKAFAIACCVSVVFSLIVARTLTPLMGAYLLRADPGKEHDEPRWMPAYQKLLRWSLGSRKHRLVIMGLGTLFFFGSVALAMMLPKDFIPVGDQSRSVMTLELPPGATLAETDAAAQAATRMLLARPEVKAVYASIGSATTVQGPGGNSGAGEVRKGTVTINLVKPGERDLSQQEFEQELSQQFAQIPGARFRFGADGSAGTLMIALVADDPLQLQEASSRLEAEMRALPQLSNVASTANLARPEILIRPIPDKAALLGVSAGDISQAARVATMGDVEAILPKYNLPDRQIPIRIRLTDEARQDLSVIENLRVPTQSGATVPLSAVADITFGAGPSQIDRLDRRRSATIQASMAPGVTLSEAQEAVNALPSKQNLPAGVTEQLVGDAEANAELGLGFGMAILTGIMLMYVVLVLLFRSFALPITILTALPVSFGGAFLLLMISGRSLSMPSLIGMIMLTGIAAKNSILLVEYAIEAQKAGMNRTEALMDAAHKRARPIIMTTVAMMAGMAPIALGFGADVAFRSPMAIAVIGGLTTSTLLSLIFVPVSYTFIDSISHRLGGRMGKAFRAQGKEEDTSGRPAPAE